MVNFDSDATVAAPAKDVMRIYLLQCKAYTEDVWRMFKKSDYSGINSGIADVRAALEQWYIVIEPIIGRHWDKDCKTKPSGIIGVISKGSKDELFNLIIEFNRLLDKIKLTKLDTRIITGKTWEQDNIAHGH